MTDWMKRVQQYQEYCRGERKRKPDLRGSDLSGADLSYSNLRRSDLSGADLSGADLSYSDLRRSDLRGSNLSGADLSYSDLSGADLSYSDLSYSDLSYSNLSGADISYSNLRGSNLSGAKGLTDPIDYLHDNFEWNREGFLAYKVFHTFHPSPSRWKIKAGEVITEVCHPDRTMECECGVNVATKRWIKENTMKGWVRENTTIGKVWHVLIRWEWLAGVVVPYNTDGKIRCSRCQLIKEVTVK